MNQLISPRDLAKKCDRSDVVIYKFAKRLGITIHHGFTEHDAERIEQAINDAKPGHPPKSFKYYSGQGA